MVSQEGQNRARARECGVWGKMSSTIGVFSPSSSRTRRSDSRISMISLNEALLVMLNISTNPWEVLKYYYRKKKK